ncbi:MAG TPA: thymidine phosphorylase, partial [Gammaproteobacteria bacterium]|nr:thymidine phosphorylase [Gammaproteobacteria bacterium]
MARSHTLKLRKIGIDTYQEAVIYMRKDCHICRAEGFEVHARILVTFKDREIIATLNTLENGFLQPGEAALSLYAWNALGVNEGDLIQIQHPSP